MTFFNLGLWSTAFFIVLSGAWIAVLEYERYRDIRRQREIARQFERVRRMTHG